VPPHDGRERRTSDDEDLRTEPRRLARAKEFTIRQKPASFNLDEVMQKMLPKS
jgi:hypothetical protein